MQRASRGLPDARGLGTGLNRRRDVRAAQGTRSVPLEHLRGAGCVRDSQGDRAVSNMGVLPLCGTLGTDGMLNVGCK